MKICIVIQSEAFRKSAGMRIRYDRFRDCIADPDTSIEAITIATLAGSRTLDHDVYIFCKTFETSALLFARRVRAAGRIVGQDLFDDYFSQVSDSRLERFRTWLRQIAPVTHFAICSTPRMAEILRPYLPDIRIVPIDDPIIGYDPLMVGALAEAKVARARETRILNVAWFGIGDNPYFPVGLSDLVAFETDLAQFQDHGWQVRLKIATNRRPFEGNGAEILRGLSCELEVIEWTEQAERDALVAATVVLLPVNGQSFSRAKSMNRAVTALSGGCQVLSLGYPIYSRLDAFLYRSTGQLIDDLSAGCCRVRRETVPMLTDSLSQLANPFESAAAFVAEAQRAYHEAPSEKDMPARLVCLIHGRASVISEHKQVMALRGLSISTIFTVATWNFPVRFDLVDREIRMRAIPALVDRYALPVMGDAAAPVLIGDLAFCDVDIASLGITPLRIFLSPDRHPLHDLVLYQDVMRVVAACCRACFGEVDLVFTDVSPLKTTYHSRADAA